MVNCAADLTIQQPASFFLPFFAAWSSLPPNEEELALRQHFLLALFALLHHHPTLIATVSATVDRAMWRVGVVVRTHI